MELRLSIDFIESSESDEVSNTPVIGAEPCKKVPIVRFTYIGCVPDAIECASVETAIWASSSSHLGKLSQP